MERKGELKAANAENGGSMLDIQSQLNLMDEQLKNLDEQIAKAQTEEFKTEEKDREGRLYDKPRTEEETMNVITSAKDKADGEVRVLKVEIKSGFGNIEKKIEKVAELRGKSTDLLEQVSEYAGAVNKAASEINNTEDKVKAEASQEQLDSANPNAREEQQKQAEE